MGTTSLGRYPAQRAATNRTILFKPSRLRPIAFLGVLLVWGFALGWYWHSAQRPALQSASVDRYGDWQVLHGWYEAQTIAGRTGRWGPGHSSVVFKPMGNGTALTELELVAPGDATGPKPVRVLGDDIPIGAIGVLPDVVRSYHLLIDLPADESGLTVELETEASISAGDPRPIGIGIASAALRAPLDGSLPLLSMAAAGLGSLILSSVMIVLYPHTPILWLSGSFLLGLLGSLQTLDRPLALQLSLALAWLGIGISLLGGIVIWRVGRERAYPWLTLVLMVIAAGALRFWGRSWEGGTEVFHPDEWRLNDVARNLRPPWNPNYFAKGTLPIYLYRGTAAVLMRISDQRWLESAAQFVLIGRSYAALLSTLTVAAVAMLGWRERRTAAGLWAALLLSGTVLAVQQAHYGTVDTMLTFQGVLIAGASLRYLATGGWRAMIVVGALLGIGLATKATALSFGIFPAVALLLRNGSRLRSPATWRHMLRHSALLLLAMAVACFVCSPYYLLDWRGMLDAMLTERRVASTGGADFTYQFFGTQPYIYYIHNALYAMGPALVLLGGAGWLWLLVRAIRRRAPRDLLLVSWPTIYFLVIGAVHIKYIRYLLPLVPFLCLFAGMMLQSMMERGGWLRRLAWLSGSLAVLTTFGYGLLFAHGTYGRPDPRLVASWWMFQHVPLDSRLLYEEHDLRLPVEIAEPENPLVAPRGSYLYELERLSLYTGGQQESPAYYAAALTNADYWIISSRRHHVTFGRMPERFPVRSCLYRSLFDGRLGYTQVARFSRGPQIGGWRIDGEWDPRIEQTFQIFDHPTVLIFRRTGEVAQAAIEQTLAEGCSQ